MKTRDEMLQQFVDGIVANQYTEHEVRAFSANWDSDYHCPAHDGRHLVIEGSVALEIAGMITTYVAGDVYDVPANTTHREVFGPEGGSLCIARRKLGGAA